PRAGLLCHPGLLNMGEGVDARACANAGITQHAMRSDVNAVSQLHLPFEHAANINKYVAATRELAPYIEAFGVGKRDALFKQTPGLFTLPRALEFGLLHPAVYAQGFP